MISYPIFITCRDRVASLLELLAWLEMVGQEEIYLVDNDSTYPPLLEYYETTRHTVLRLGGNYRQYAVWKQGVLEQYAADRYFVVTDPDIVPIEQCPHDALEVFRSLLDQHADVTKCGFSLKIDDLPDRYDHKQLVYEWEEQFWHTPCHGRYLAYHAPIDTTFALYRPGATWSIDNCLRTAPPYTARHTTWYINSADLSPEMIYYQKRAAEKTIHWSLVETRSVKLNLKDADDT